MTTENLIYLDCTGYLRQWCENRFGSPAHFPKGSIENEILSRYIIARPANVAPVPDGWRSMMPVHVPCFHCRPFQQYNYLTDEGRFWLLKYIRNLFILDLMQAMMPKLAYPNLYESIMTWCESRGITADHFSAVIKKFYRVRCGYEAHGIIIRKRYVRRKTERGIGSR